MDTRRIKYVESVIILWEVLVLPNKLCLRRVEDYFSGKDTPDSLLRIQCPQFIQSSATKHFLGELCKPTMAQSVKVVGVAGEALGI